MDIADIKQLNVLWRKIYPYLASHIMEEYGRDSGAVLELGPFSGGISIELARSYSKLDITVADSSPEITEFLRQEVASYGLADRIEVRSAQLDRLAFDDSRFDLVISRGAFFFLDERGEFLREVFRVLKNGGMAFVGGGYGNGVPGELIEDIADESRRLNRRLGKKWFGIPELQQIVTRSELTANCSVVEEGGLWLIIRK
jgi:ubiquinone/menaquinone biosynthesis C-methylase UbiE